MVRHAGLLFALLLATACGQLPRPFQPVDKNGNALLDLENRAGIVVRPVTRDAPGRPAEAAELLAAALRHHDLPASTQGLNRASRILTGRAAVLRLPGGGDEVMVHWELRDTSGARVGRHEFINWAAASRMPSAPAGAIFLLQWEALPHFRLWIYSGEIQKHKL